jgi:hypothetical protein
MWRRDKRLSNLPKRLIFKQESIINDGSKLQGSIVSSGQFAVVTDYFADAARPSIALCQLDLR